MKNKITEIFDAVAGADNIKAVGEALKRSVDLSNDEQRVFLKCLREDFSKISAQRPNGFKLSHVHPLNENDLSQGFHIGFKKGS